LIQILNRESCVALFGDAPHSLSAYPQEPACNYRKSYRYYYRDVPGSDRGFAESLPGSDRGFCREVIVDKSAYPKSLRTGGRLAWSRKPPTSTSIRALW
jgi:hypothetical protein